MNYPRLAHSAATKGIRRVAARKRGKGSAVRKRIRDDRRIVKAVNRPASEISRLESTINNNIINVR